MRSDKVLDGRHPGNIKAALNCIDMPVKLLGAEFSLKGIFKQNGMTARMLFAGN